MAARIWYVITVMGIAVTANTWFGDTGEFPSTIFATVMVISYYISVTLMYVEVSAF